MGLIKTEQRAAKDLQVGDRIVRSDADYRITEVAPVPHNYPTNRVVVWAYRVPTQWCQAGKEEPFFYPEDHEVCVLPAG